MRAWQRETLGVLGALLVAIGATAVLTWPMIPLIDTIVMGGGELGGWLWRYDWHFRELQAIQDAGLGPLGLWKAFVGLGRYPETGNILDVLAFNFPLERFFGFPASYNLKIVLVLALNGIAGYALGRYVSGSIAGALAASAVAVMNPLTILEIQASGLRQALLWWVLLFPAALDRALRRRSLPAGIVAGACWGLAGAFYWFYGLFSGVFALVWGLRHLGIERKRLDGRGLVRAGLGVGLGLLLTAGPFILPYACGESAGSNPGGGGGGGGMQALPEMTFVLPYPAFDTVANAPLRPQTYAENVLASIHRTIGSAWSAGYPFDPTLNEALPLTVLAFGVLPAIVRRRAWSWLAVWLFFYLGTLGPFLRWGGGDAKNVVRVGAYVVRMPYTLMFQFIPGMSRMFAPYRLGSYVVVASVALVAIGVARLRWRAWVAPLVVIGTVAQPLYRFGKGSINEGAAESGEWRSPIKANRIRVPEPYLAMAEEPPSGIVELPLEQQQDLLCVYQIHHGRKIYRSWASPGAIPPALRKGGVGGLLGESLRYQARADESAGGLYAIWDALSKDPEGADLAAMDLERFRKWARANRYRRVILHERGYFLVNPSRGGALYESAVRRVGQALGLPAAEHVDELVRGDPANPQFGVPTSGDLVPWSSQPTDLGPGQQVARFRMAIYDVLPELGAATTADEVPDAPLAVLPGGAPPAAPVHVEAPPGAPKPAAGAGALDNPPAPEEGAR